MKKLIILFTVLILALTQVSGNVYDSSNTGICDSYQSSTDTCTINTDKYYRHTDITLNFQNVVGSGRIITAGQDGANGGYDESGESASGPGGNVEANIGNEFSITSVITDGGNGGDGSGCCNYNGGSGTSAGDITIEAQKVDLEQISARGGSGGNGVSCCGSGGNGGSGGQITINADAVNASNIRADGGGGGNGGYDGGGGSASPGGEVVLNATGKMNVTNQISATGGSGSSGNPGRSSASGAPITINAGIHSMGGLSTDNSNVNIDADRTGGSSQPTTLSAPSSNVNLDYDLLQLVHDDYIVSGSGTSFDITIKKIDLREDYNFEINANSGTVNLYYNHIYGLADDSVLEVTTGSGTQNIARTTFRSQYMYLYKGSLSDAGNNIPTASANISIEDELGETAWGPHTYDNIVNDGRFAILLGRENPLNLYPGKKYYIISRFDIGSSTYNGNDVEFGRPISSLDNIPILPN